MISHCTLTKYIFSQVGKTDEEAAVSNLYLYNIIILLLCVTFWSSLTLHVLNYTIVFYPWLVLLYYSSLMKHNVIIISFLKLIINC